MYLHSMASKTVQEEEGLVGVSLEPFGDASSRLEDFFVGWSVVHEIFIFSAIICNGIPCRHNSNFIDVFFALEQL